MTKRLILVALMVLVALAVPPALESRVQAEPYPKLAPYTQMRWAGEQPEVEVDGRFYRLRAIDGVSADRLVAFGKTTYPRIWKKRVSEDLVQVMTELGQPPRDKVTLRLEELDSHAELVRKDVPMTKENRRQVWRANQAAGI